MPLQDIETQSYIKRTRVYISNDERDPDTSKGPYEYTVNLQEEIQNVTSIELVGWNIPRYLTASFLGRYTQSVLPYASNSNPRGDTPGTSIADVFIVNETATATLSFVLDMELVTPTLPALPVSYAGRKMTIDQITAAFQQAIPLALDAAGHATLNTTNYTLNIGVDTNNRFFFNMHRIGLPATQASVQFLLATGDNKEDSFHRLLGLPKTDTTIDPSTSGIQSPCAIEPEPYRYIDIEIKQAPKFRPFARIFTSGDIQGDEFKRQVNTPENVRLFTDPVRRLDKLSIKLRLQDDKAPNHEILTGHDLTFEILSIAPTDVLPVWANQKFVY
jgi:hypothetical protein